MVFVAYPSENERWDFKTEKKRMVFVAYPSENERWDSRAS